MGGTDRQMWSIELMNKNFVSSDGRRLCSDPLARPDSIKSYTYGVSDRNSLLEKSISLGAAPRFAKTGLRDATSAFPTDTRRDTRARAQSHL